MARKEESAKSPKAPTLPSLTQGMSAAQVYVCQLVAEYLKPAEILALCRDYIARGTIRESWVRHVCTSGQAIKLDSVIQDIAQEVNA